MRLADYLPSKRAKPKGDHERRIKMSLMRDVLKVLEGRGHEDAAKVLRGVYGEYE